uniref:TIR domain-containing protein n=1 Tax=Candidatus Kentrum sp. FW TaxID=2126338 RepID=A0A450T3F2_9GAMM|nr:MAG: TIR domain-containing protein [Candidatus Kentron sp. FW]
MTKRFAIALSFPGEHRAFVREIAEHLAELLGKERIFYDDWYEADLLGTDLDLKLTGVYGKESEMVVPFFSEHYQKPWCGIEWATIREIMKDHRKENRVIPVAMDDTPIEGWGSLNYPIYPKGRSGREIAELIRDVHRQRFPDHETPPLKQRIGELMAGLSKSMSGFEEIDQPLQEVMERLEGMAASGEENTELMDSVKRFMDRQLSVKEFIADWNTKHKAGSVSGPDFSIWADDLKYGDPVLFLGSQLTRTVQNEALTHRILARRLMERMRLKNTTPDRGEPSLAEIAHQTPRVRLLRTLYEALSQAKPNAPLYALLARIAQPLLIISTAYDEFLETALEQEGRKFVRITPLLDADGYQPERVRLSYARSEKPDEEMEYKGLSNLDLIGKGYTIIYKIFGICKDPAADSSIAIAERDFFQLTENRKRDR